MSTTPPAPFLRLCHFDSPFLPMQPYFCYEDEVCCKEGCCTPYQHTYIQSWHFWYKIYIVLAIIIFLLLYRYICWYCKKKDRNNNLRCEDDNNSHVVNLMVAYNSRNGGAPKDDNDDPPPRYNVAVHLPKPANQDQVPTYEQATSMN